MKEIKVWVRHDRRYVCVEPGTSHVQYRDTPGSWEEAVASVDDKGKGSIRMVASGKVLCLTPDYTLETRDTVGPWETLHMASQPENFDKLHLAYRAENGVVVGGLQLEKR